MYCCIFYFFKASCMLDIYLVCSCHTWCFLGHLLSACAVAVRSGSAQWQCAVAVHSGSAQWQCADQWQCAVAVHSGSVQWQCTVAVRSDSAQWQCAVTVHSGSAQISGSAHVTPLLCSPCFSLIMCPFYLVTNGS